MHVLDKLISSKNLYSEILNQYARSTLRLTEQMYKQKVIRMESCEKRKILCRERERKTKTVRASYTYKWNINVYLRFLAWKQKITVLCAFRFLSFGCKTECELACKHSKMVEQAWCFANALHYSWICKIVKVRRNKRIGRIDCMLWPDLDELKCMCVCVYITCVHSRQLTDMDSYI